jgi:hypothetical protein
VVEALAQLRHLLLGETAVAGAAPGAGACSLDISLIIAAFAGARATSR